MSTSDNQMNFENTKPDIAIINNDKDNEVTQNLIDYMTENCNVKKDITSEEAIDDAVFYRDVNYVIYIPDGYGEAVLNGENPQINTKSSGDYNASLAEMLLERYVQVQNIYSKEKTDAKELNESVNRNMSSNAKIQVTSKVDTKKTSNAATYFSFASYSILALIILIVCLVLSSFHEKNVSKRTIISSMDYKKHNARLLGASFVYAVVVWILFVMLAVILLGDIMFTRRGIVYMVNSFAFTWCTNIVPGFQ